MPDCSFINGRFVLVSRFALSPLPCPGITRYALPVPVRERVSSPFEVSARGIVLVLKDSKAFPAWNRLLYIMISVVGSLPYCFPFSDLLGCSSTAVVNINVHTVGVFIYMIKIHYTYIIPGTW